MNMVMYFALQDCSIVRYYYCLVVGFLVAIDQGVHRTAFIDGTATFIGRLGGTGIVYLV